MISFYPENPVDPVGAAKHWASGIPAQSGLVAVFGLGSGHHIRSLLEKCEDEAVLIVCNPDQRPNRIKDRRVRVISNPEHFRRHFSSHYSRFHPSTLLKLPGYAISYPDQWSAFAQNVRKEVQSVLSDVVTGLRFSLDWSRNTIKNWAHIERAAPVRRLFGKWEGKPLVIVSAGPSLAEHFTHLRRAKGKAFIVAVGTVLPVLIREGIEPDLVIAFDGALDNYRAHFRGSRTRSTLVYDQIVNHKIVEEWKGPRALMSIWPAPHLLNDHIGKEVGFVSIGPSVANTALHLAIQMKADPVILVGQDLAFVAGRTHADGTHLDHYVNAQYSGPETTTVLSNSGEMVSTTRTWRTFQHVFEKLLAAHKVRVINTSRSGARVKGAEYGRFPRLNRDRSAEIAAILENLNRPPGYDMDRARSHLRAALIAGERLRARLPDIDYANELPAPCYWIFQFAFQPAWDGACSGRERDWCCHRTRRALDYCLPLLQETLCKIRP